jgi:hypothetical protein
MQASKQLPLVKNTSSGSNVARVKSVPRTPTQPKAGARFLGFLISALGAPNV